MYFLWAWNNSSQHLLTTWALYPEPLCKVDWICFNTGQIQAAVVNCFETGGASTDVILLGMVIFQFFCFPVRLCTTDTFNTDTALLGKLSCFFWPPGWCLFAFASKYTGYSSGGTFFQAQFICVWKLHFLSIFLECQRRFQFRKGCCFELFASFNFWKMPTCLGCSSL